MSVLSKIEDTNCFEPDECLRCKWDIEYMEVGSCLHTFIGTCLKYSCTVPISCLYGYSLIKSTPAFKDIYNEGKNYNTFESL